MQNERQKLEIVINEQHSLKKEQRELLEKQFPLNRWNHNYIKVPEAGWSFDEQNQQAGELTGKTVVFVSPVPYVLAKLSFWQGYGEAGSLPEVGLPLKGGETEAFLFHNDNREKKELPNGRTISVVAETGWELVSINKGRAINLAQDKKIEEFEIEEEVVVEIEMDELDKYRLELSNSGIPSLWEKGGGMTNSGSAIIIAGPKGEALKPIYVKTKGHLSNGDHALIPVTIGDIIIDTWHSRKDFEISVNKIVDIDVEDLSVYTENLYNYDMGEWNSPLPDFLNDAVEASKEKSLHYHCKEPYYIDDDKYVNLDEMISGYTNNTNLDSDTKENALTNRADSYSR